jgi:hypothetical protein
MSKADAKAEPVYFFDGGLTFACTQCGKCCTGEPGEVIVNDKERAALARHLKLTPEEVRKQFCRSHRGKLLLKEKVNGDCIFYKDGCTVYPARPMQCRTYPFWVDNLRSEEAWADTCAACPGIGEGRLYRRAEILRILRRSPI